MKMLSSSISISIEVGPYMKQRIQRRAFFEASSMKGKPQTQRLRRRTCALKEGSSVRAPSKLPSIKTREGPSTDPRIIWMRLRKLVLPFWADPEVGNKAKLKLGGVILLTVATTVLLLISWAVISLMHYPRRNLIYLWPKYLNFLFLLSLGFQSLSLKTISRDFYNALAAKDPEQLQTQIIKFVLGTLWGTPIFVSRRYFKSKLSLEWREWMSKKFLNDYLENNSFYKVQATAAFDNPDQRISVDVQQFTSIALGFVLTILNAGIDLASFSGILFSIYPPLFVALFAYSVGGTWLSVIIGRKLVGLNFRQEAKEADFRFGLVRLRENAESIAFYNGQKKEENLLTTRLKRAVLNFQDLLLATRNLDFFTSFYRFLIMFLPAAVVAPLFFKGEIEFGVVTQSQSAFSHILNDVSLVVYQFEAIAGFGAVIDRLGEFQETIQKCNQEELPTNGEKNQEQIQLESKDPPTHKSQPLLSVQDLTLLTPDSSSVLIKDLNLQIFPSKSLLVMGASGVGKTSLLRAIAGLWKSGKGTITRYGAPVSSTNKNGNIMFVPQRPYLVLGTLRDQLLYPTWAENISSSPEKNDKTEDTTVRPVPDDLELEKAMLNVNLGDVLKRCKEASPIDNPLDSVTDWSSQLSIGEQQRLAFARILLTNPQLLLMDESTSALDIQNERAVYQLLERSDISYVSVGHRPTLKQFHTHALHLTPGEREGEGSEWKLESLESFQTSELE